MSAVTVRRVQAEDFEAWNRLYRGYRDFYKKPHDPAVLTTVWGWLQDPHHEVRCLVAEYEGRVVALGHFRRFARPLDGGHALYLDDLFSDPESRGQGAATAILNRLAEVARDEGAVLVRWITAADNETARRIYDRESTATTWVTYDLAPAK